MSTPKPHRIIENRAAPNCRRVRIFLAEKGIDIPFEQIDIMAGEHFQEKHKDMVGTFRVPVLAFTDGSFITESIAICRFFEEYSPRRPLFGKTDYEKALVEMWQRRVEFELLWPIAFVLRHGNPKMSVLEKQCLAWSEANKPRVLEGLETLNKQLDGNEYVTGPNFSIADITAIVSINFLRTIKVDISPKMGSIIRWRENLSKRISMSV